MAAQRVIVTRSACLEACHLAAFGPAAACPPAPPPALGDENGESGAGPASASAPEGSAPAGGPGGELLALGDLRGLGRLLGLGIRCGCGLRGGAAGGQRLCRL